MRIRDRRWTVLLTSARGRATRTLRVPEWAARSAGGLCVLALCAAVLLGWHLQALFGLVGSCMSELDASSLFAERAGAFMSLAHSKDAPTTAERVRAFALSRAKRLGLGTRRTASDLLLGEVAPAWQREAERGRKADGNLLWPVKNGWFGRGFGSGAGGYHLAVDIAAQTGSDVRAAAPGIVGYAGNELKGYGNVIMLVHPGGLVTLYGHNKQNLVVPGQRVRKGETIAYLGSTGRSMGPHVHFELKHDGRNCDPMPLIAPGPGSYKNYVPSLSPVAWRPNATRPSSVRCHRRIPFPGHLHDEEAAEASNGARSKSEVGG